ncbi:related to Glucan 1,3-beta-glucosidase precursor [Sporisorium reilianum SRZ2]|uniref:Related to Glucan 1,3-beta-glucosidase n=1 Tax=Sporisorium reilianum (strain SRZ2) TaxID=999809 RepID=E6ZTL7_SPORE|nr:related to Glucan 1,3-beta-glucosidase precursor [Sporisorium reilianum SRZ2]
MRLLPRDTSLNAVASALSLAAANYKPIPQLPTANQSSAIANANTGGRNTVSSKPNSFQVQKTGSTTDWSSTHKSSDWGVPSTLYVPVESLNQTSNGTDADSARKLASSRKVGPGGCPYSAGYTPNGGWDKLPPPTFPAFDPVKATIMRYRQQQGVNLGTWFVQEGWMENNFMSCATGPKQAEFDILDGFGTSSAGLSSARAYMEQHWDTWITEDDFRSLAQMGINTVRLPIGYWSAGPYFTHYSPFEQYKSVYEFSWRYIARAINWAAKYDIGVIVDLHGAYGSQNGQAHSGLSDGNIEWYNSWNQNLTTELLVWIAKEISDVTNVIGIQLLNEPQNRDSYWTWLPTAMDAMRASSPYAKNVPLYFHDAFVLEKGAAFVQKRSDFVVSDHHSYYVYTSSDQALSAQGHISKLDGSIFKQFAQQSSVARRNLIVGEWSCALAWSSIQNSKNPTQDQTEFCQTQQDIWQTTGAGWTFWSYKMEDCDQNSGWCFQSAAKKFLQGNFSSWGIAVSSPSLATAGNVTGDKLGSLSPIRTDISRVRLPTNSTTTALKTAKSFLAVGASENDDGDDISSVGPNGFGHSLYATAAANSPAQHDKPLERGIGSYTTFAARQAQQDRVFVERAAATNATVASRGFSDGFYTSRILASSTDSLSRLGFATQYQQDTFQSYVAAGRFKTSDAAAYNSQFVAGVKAAENSISYIVSSYANKAKA